MNMKNLSGILLLFLCTFSVISCDKEADFKDKVKVITIYVSGETSTYTPSVYLEKRAPIPLQGVRNQSNACW